MTGACGGDPYSLSSAGIQATTWWGGQPEPTSKQSSPRQRPLRGKTAETNCGGATHAYTGTAEATLRWTRIAQHQVARNSNSSRGTFMGMIAIKRVVYNPDTTNGKRPMLERNCTRNHRKKHQLSRNAGPACFYFLTFSRARREQWLKRVCDNESNTQWAYNETSKTKTNENHEQATSHAPNNNVRGGTILTQELEPRWPACESKEPTCFVTPYQSLLSHNLPMHRVHFHRLCRNEIHNEETCRQ